MDTMVFCGQNMLVNTSFTRGMQSVSGYLIWIMRIDQKAIAFTSSINKHSHHFYSACIVLGNVKHVGEAGRLVMKHGVPWSREAVVLWVLLIPLPRKG